MSSYFLIFFLNIAIEYLILLFLERKEWLTLLFYAVLVNAFTHPLLHLTIGLLPWNYWVNLGILETCVWLTETVLLALLLQCTWKRGCFLSFCMNFVSMSVGIIWILFFN